MYIPLYRFVFSGSNGQWNDFNNGWSPAQGDKRSYNAGGKSGGGRGKASGKGAGGKGAGKWNQK